MNLENPNSSAILFNNSLHYKSIFMLYNIIIEYFYVNIIILLITCVGFTLFNPKLYYLCNHSKFEIHGRDVEARIYF